MTYWRNELKRGNMGYDKSRARQVVATVDRGWTVELLPPGWGVLPYLISMLGVLLDYLTTAMGLGLGLYESHPSFNPLLAVAAFWGIQALVNLMLPKGRVRTFSTRMFVIVSFLGALNNTLVIMGVIGC
jgi:hypothetical protein